MLARLCFVVLYGFKCFRGLVGFYFECVAQKCVTNTTNESLKTATSLSSLYVRQYSRVQDCGFPNVAAACVVLLWLLLYHSLVAQTLNEKMNWLYD
uniref:Secreted protein n=1 Tax=Anopheles darlingi TaxID=43151 RepID=A0A2M4D070_ANODA